MPLVYTMNDEDGSPQIFAVEVATGKTIGTADLNPALPSNADPESIRLDVKTGILYLADIGDNDANRPTFPTTGYTALYGLPEFGPGDHGTLPCKRYPVAFPGDAKINAESLAINPVNGRMYIITKEAGGSRLYRLPSPLVPNAKNVMTFVRRLETANVSDATFTINGQWLLVRSASPDIAVYDDNNFRKAGAFSGTVQAKGESIAAEPNGKSVLLGSEGRGGNGKGSPIYRVILPTKYRGISTPTAESPSQSPTQPMANKPGQIFNTRVWKLTLPIGKRGDPDEILYPALATYEHPKYFFDSNGRVVFNTPHGGVTTGGSVNPRTELREMKTNGDPANWSSTRGQNRLTLTKVSVNHVGAVEKLVTFMQLHDADDDRVMVLYEGTSATAGNLWAEWGNGKGQGGTRDLIMPYTLGQVVPKIALLVNASGFRVLVNDVSQAFTARTASGSYFKAGCYPQHSGDEADSDFAQVRIGGIVVSHT
jgi:hypothetical protein